MKLQHILLTIALCAASVMAARADTYQVTARSTLNVRNAPSAKGKVMARLSSGQTVEVLSVQGKWAKVSLDGARTGYVAVQYLTRIEETNERVEHEQVTDDTVVNETKEEIKTDADTDRDSVSHDEDKDSRVHMLFDSKVLHTSDISIYLAGQVNLGWSNFLWNEGDCTGDFAYGVDAVLQVDFNNQVSFIPRNWYSELSIGYKKLGAANMGINYIGLNVLPLGYSVPVSNFKLKGKAGVSLSMPLNGVSTDYNDFDGAFQVGVAAGLQLEYRQFGIGVNVEYDFMDALKDLDINKLNNLAVMGTLIYKFGKL